MTKRADEHKRKLNDWLDAPDTGYDDWFKLSYEDIGLFAGVPTSAAYRYLTAVLVDRGYTEQEIADRRRVEHLRKSNRLSDRQIERLREMRSQDPPIGYLRCSRALGISRNAVMKRCKKMGI